MLWMLGSVANGQVSPAEWGVYSSKMKVKRAITEDGTLQVDVSVRRFDRALEPEDLFLMNQAATGAVCLDERDQQVFCWTDEGFRRVRAWFEDPGKKQKLYWYGRKIGKVRPKPGSVHYIDEPKTFPSFDAQMPTVTVDEVQWVVEHEPESPFPGLLVRYTASDVPFHYRAHRWEAEEAVVRDMICFHPSGMAMVECGALPEGSSVEMLVQVAKGATHLRMTRPPLEIDLATITSTSDYAPAGGEPFGPLEDGRQEP